MSERTRKRWNIGRVRARRMARWRRQTREMRTAVAKVVGRIREGAIRQLGSGRN